MTLNMLQGPGTVIGQQKLASPGRRSWPEKWPVDKKVGQLAMAAEPRRRRRRLREVAATLRASGTAPKLQTLQFLGGLGLDEEECEVTALLTCE